MRGNRQPQFISPLFKQFGYVILRAIRKTFHLYLNNAEKLVFILCKEKNMQDGVA